jgi:hypothetical protein
MQKLVRPYLENKPGILLHISVIPAVQEVEVGGLWFPASPGKVSLRPYLKTKLKGFRAWLKW